MANKYSRAERKMFNLMEYCEKSGKPMYDKRGAQTAKNFRMKRDHAELRIYNCPDCGAWHLTKQKYYRGKDFRNGN